jgi:hypothetical protein
MTLRSVPPGTDTPSLCGGPKRQSPGPCTRPAGWGTGHPGSGRCKLHGGSTRNHEKHWDTRRAEDKARRALKDLDPLNTRPESIENPLAELSRLAGEVVRWKDILAAHVSELNSLRYRGGGETGDTEQIRGEVVLFERALDRCERVLVSIAKLNIDERLARIDERLADMIVTALEAGLDSIGVDGEQADRAKSVTAREMRRQAS